jgi:hypothetical protein
MCHAGTHGIEARQRIGLENGKAHHAIYSADKRIRWATGFFPSMSHMLRHLEKSA